VVPLRERASAPFVTLFRGFIAEIGQLLWQVLDVGRVIGPDVRALVIPWKPPIKKTDRAKATEIRKKISVTNFLAGTTSIGKSTDVDTKIHVHRV
jgi:hypothetical protein